MIKALGIAIVVFANIGMGVYFIKWYIATTHQGTSPVLGMLGGGFILFGMGLAVVETVHLFTRNKKDDMFTMNNLEGTNIVQKNTELINEYQKLNTNRDKLKILKYAAAVEEEKK